MNQKPFRAGHDLPFAEAAACTGKSAHAGTIQVFTPLPPQSIQRIIQHIWQTKHLGNYYDISQNFALAKSR